VQAQRLLDYTASLHGNIAAAEYMNEPTFASLGGAPKGYDAAQYGRDYATFLAFIRANAPTLKIAGPGSVGESTGTGLNAGIGGVIPGFIPTPKLLAAMGNNSVDIFSYHMYGGVSQRCKMLGAANQTTPEAALTEQWLATTSDVLAYYKQRRDESDPGKPIWLTETGETACGGNPWAATFLDSFRYLDQLGRLAKAGVQVTMHNTLAASDYALLDENTYMPRPNFWAALLWRRFMGTTVLDSNVPLQHGLHVYAHCESNHPGGVALLVIQNDADASHTLTLPTPRSVTPFRQHPLNWQPCKRRKFSSITLRLNWARTTACPSSRLCQPQQARSPLRQRRLPSLLFPKPITPLADNYFVQHD
jgi:hypothetical protein